MNCPSRVDETLFHEGWNQNPPALAADTTTRQDLNGIANLRQQRGPSPCDEDEKDKGRKGGLPTDDPESGSRGGVAGKEASPGVKAMTPSGQASLDPTGILTAATLGSGRAPSDTSNAQSRGGSMIKRGIMKVFDTVRKYTRFIGPGFLVAVAYIDPGNYSTDVAAGAAFRFRLLFIVLMSNIFAIFLQSLCIKLGTVTGLNLAEHCRAHFPKWLNIVLYLFGEAAIIATDIAEVCKSRTGLRCFSISQNHP